MLWSVIAAALLEQEVLDGSQIRLLIEGKPLAERPPVPPPPPAPAGAQHGTETGGRPELRPAPGFTKG